MATLMSNSTGNFSSAATWSLIDSTSFLNSETNTTNTTTAFVSSSTFITGVITIDGIAVKVSARSGAPSGTFSVRLFNSTLAAAVAGTTVTINVSDIVSVLGSTNDGWLFMKFASSVTLLGANSYAVQVQSSVNAQVTLYRDATAGNWSRALRTTTTQAPAASDDLFVNGEHISAGSNNSFTVTMDNTSAATTYGQVQVCTKGLLAYGVAASTAYYLKIAGNLSIYTNGTFSMGTSGTPIPSTSTAQLEFANASNVQFGLESRIGSSLIAYGATKTVRALLNADASASATSLTTDVSTGWKSGDVIALASTTRTASDAESKALTADASGTTLTIAAITSAHSGSSPTQAELANLTRNVQIFGTSTANQAYVNIVTTATVDCQYVEFYNMGSATALKRGIDNGVTTGSISMRFCSIHDFIVASSLGINCNSGTGNNFTFSDLVFYNIANDAVNTVATTGTNISYSNLLAIKNVTAGIPLFNFGDLGGSISGITATSGVSAGIVLGDTGNFTGTVSTLTAHSNAGIGISIVNVTAPSMGTISTCVSWRNNTFGLSWNNSFAVTLDGVTAFGNLTANVTYASESSNLIMKNMVVDAGTTLTCPIGLQISIDNFSNYVDSSTFGASQTHATADVSVTAANTFTDIIFRNCLFNSTNKIINVSTNCVNGARVSSARHQQTAGNHITFKKYGTIVPDATIFNKGSPSVRMTPNSATQKLQGSMKKVAVPNGLTVTVSVFVRKSVAGDGTAYNGNQPRLILKADPAVGITSDTILATATNAANGAFQLLTATTSAITDDAALQFFIDCDGTAGWVNVDDWSVNS